MYVLRVRRWRRLTFTIRSALTTNGSTAASPPIYALLANIHLAHARKAPKLVLSDASMPCVAQVLLKC